MKKMQSIGLLDDLQADTRQIMLATNYLLQEDPGDLVQQPAPGKWSVAQVIEHLNTYGRYYLPAIEAALKEPTLPNADFTPGWLGDYFTKMMMPKENGKITNKMQAPKGHRPSVDIDSKPVIEEFLKQEQLMLELLERAKGIDIGRVRIPISLSRLIKLKLGDTFRFLIAHHQRHFVQVSNTLRALKEREEVVAG